MNMRDRIKEIAGKRMAMPAEDDVPSNQPTVESLRRMRKDNVKVRLTEHEEKVAEGVLPYIGDQAVLPDKVNPAVPDNIWACLQDSGAMAAVHLNLMLHDRNFPKLHIRDQARIIELALSRAYGGVDGSVRKNLHVFVNPEDDKGFNALAEMARKAHKMLPEFINASTVNASPLEGSDDDASD